VISTDDNTLTHAEPLQAHVLDAVVWVTKSQIAQRLHGIIRVIFRYRMGINPTAQQGRAPAGVSPRNNRDRKKPQAGCRAF